VEVGVVARKAVTRLREVDQGYVSGMEEVNVAKLLTALKVLKATQVSAFHMVVVAGKALSLSVSVSLDLFSRILSVQFASTRELYTLHMVCCLDWFVPDAYLCRCQFMGCSKGAQGSTMFCKAHGGGKRCIIKDCNKGAEGSTPLCKGHGGGKRCMYDGGGICTKSVHGGTLFCVAHGGGKRCTVEGCGKSARGRTDHCVKHGGGKRCKVDGCGKSAQGSTDFCKAHGGGKRCQWGVEGSTAADSLKDSNGGRAAGAPCDKFARGKSGLCAAHSALVQDRRVHGGGTVGNVVTAGLAPGLFRGLVSGSGQTQPRTINSSTTISGPSTTPVAASSRAATSASDKEMGSAAATQGFDLHGKLQFCSLVFVLQQLVWRPVCKLRSFQTLLNS